MHVIEQMQRMESFSGHPSPGVQLSSLLHKALEEQVKKRSPDDRSSLAVGYITTAAALDGCNNKGSCMLGL